MKKLILWTFAFTALTILATNASATVITLDFEGLASQADIEEFFSRNLFA
jgi:hypothetical protein